MDAPTRHGYISETIAKQRGMGDSSSPDTSNADREGPVCGSENTTTGEPCQFPVSTPDDRCHMHPADESGPPEGHGEGTADQNKVAAAKASGQGAPADNKNALNHGYYAAERDPSGLFDYFRDETPGVAEQIRRWFWSYMNDAPFEAYGGEADRYHPPVLDVVDVEDLDAQQDLSDEVADLDTVSVPAIPDARQHVAADAPPIDVQSLRGKAHRLFVVCVHQAVLSRVTLTQARDLLTTMQQQEAQSGRLVEVETELPVNKAKARMRQRDLQELKQLGVLDDPDSAKASAMASWGAAAQRVAEREDS